MKKFGKFIFGTLSLASLAAGAYYLYKNYIKKDTTDDFDEFEDDFEDFETEDDETETEPREYVSINLDTPGASPEENTAPEEEKIEEAENEENAEEEEDTPNDETTEEDASSTEINE